MRVLSRIVAVTMLVATAGAMRAGAQQTYAPGFGVSAPLMATGNTVSATYYGWEPTTVYGHEIYALTGTDYITDVANGCFAFSSLYRGACDGPSNVDLAGLLGLPLFGKPYGVTCPVPAQACFGAPSTRVFSWTPGTEVIFALLVNQNNAEYNWFFSGNPTRNLNSGDGSDGYAHLAFFPSGVPANEGVGTVSGTAGVGLFGFEDVTYEHSDWDFNNAIFSVDNGSIVITPEPATMTLLAGGLIALSALSARGRRKPLDA